MHLLDLARTANQRPRSGARPRRTSASRGVRPVLLRLLDAISTPAYVRNGRMEILALNRLALFMAVWYPRPARR